MRLETALMFVVAIGAVVIIVAPMIEGGAELLARIAASIPV